MSSGSDNNYLVGARAAVRPETIDQSSTQRLKQSGYWPARAATLLDAREYAQVIALCRERLDEDAQAWSGRIIYALALYHTGQLEASERQLQQVLSWDPDNLVALKTLGDIRFAQQDQFGAFSLYRRVLEIDPDCHGLKCELEAKRTTTTRTVSLKRPAEKVADNEEDHAEIPFYTETLGDLYLDQGHHRMAARVYRQLFETDGNPRWQEKLQKAERRTGNRPEKRS